MMDAQILDELRGVAGQQAALPALRVTLFAFGLIGAFAWSRRAYRAAFVATATGAFVGLLFWLLQMATPLGLGTDSGLSGEWAQAGVNAGTRLSTMGYVFGTEPSVSLPGSLAAAGFPTSAVFLLPQLGVVIGLALFLLLPWICFRNRRTSSFAACLLAGGGLWPSIAPYDGLLTSPSQIWAIVAAVLIFAGGTRSHAARRWLRLRRAGISGTLVALAATGAAAGATLLSAILFILATTMLAPMVRLLLRVLADSGDLTRRLEAALIALTFAGSGVLWWNPNHTTAGFTESRDVSSALKRPMNWIAANVENDGVILASPLYSASIAALGGRRVIFPIPSSFEGPLPQRARRARLYESVLNGRPAGHLVEAFSVSHLLLGPGDLSPTVGQTDNDAEVPFSLVLVYVDAEDFRIFRLAKK